MENVNKDMENKKSSDKFMRMTIRWLTFLPTAGFSVAVYGNPQDAINNREFVKIRYKGRKVLEMSNYWDYCYLTSFVEYLDTEEIPNRKQLGEAVKITSKSDLVNYLESLREKVYPDLSKLNVMDMLLDVAQDI